MNLFSHIAIIITYGILAVFFALLANEYLDMFGSEIGIIVGFFSFLLLLQCHSIYFWRFGKQEMEHRLLSLHQDYQTALDQLDQSQIDIQGIQKIAHNSDLGKTSEVVAEMKVLQTLLSQVVLRSRKTITGQGQILHSKGAPLKAGAEQSITQEVVHSDKEVLNIIHHALEDNSIDLYLQPIVTLPSRKVSFYEAYSRVRDEEDNIIYPSRYLKLAEESGLVGTLDNLLLFRCIQIIRGLGPRRPDIKVFCNISAVSMNDIEFFPQFVGFMLDNSDLSDRLVFEFAQQDVNRHSNNIWKSLQELGEHGFRFSMDNVEEMDFDLSHLSINYFRYLKLDAKYFLGDHMDIHPADIKENFNRYDIDLIVEKIETDQMVVEVLEHDVDYGQGYLFGEPKISTQTEIGG